MKKNKKFNKIILIPIRFGLKKSNNKTIINLPIFTNLKEVVILK